MNKCDKCCIKDEYFKLKIRYDRYDDICLDYGMLGFTLGILLTLVTLSLLLGWMV